MKANLKITMGDDSVISIDVTHENPELVNAMVAHIAESLMQYLSDRDIEEEDES